MPILSSFRGTVRDGDIERAQSQVEAVDEAVDNKSGYREQATSSASTSTAAPLSLEEAGDETPSQHQSILDRLKRKRRQDVEELLRQNKRDEPLTGYPALAEFLGSDDRWMIFRRFSQLQARLILEKQDQLRNVEQDLIFFDEEDFLKSKTDNLARLDRRRRQNPEEREAREEIMRRAETVFTEYADLLTAAQRLASFGKPETHELESVQRYIYFTKPIVLSESNWIFQKRDDIVTLRESPRYPFNFAGGVFEWLVSMTHYSQIANSETTQTWLEWNDKVTRIAKASMWIVLLIIVEALFILPIYALSTVGNDVGKSIGILVSCAFVFALVLCGTPAKPHEILNSTAAYLAVLCVFFGSYGS